MSELRSVIEAFTSRLSELIHADALARARSSVLAAFGVDSPAPKRRGRPPKALQSSVSPTSPREARKKPRKKAPLQLCPVPGCKNPAAPAYGMVCAKHKDLPKATIKKFREARKARKLGLAPAKPSSRAKRRAPKAAAPTPKKGLAAPKKATKKATKKAIKKAPKKAPKKAIKKLRAATRPAQSTTASPASAVVQPAPAAATS